MHLPNNNKKAVSPGTLPLSASPHPPEHSDAQEVSPTASAVLAPPPSPAAGPPKPSPAEAETLSCDALAQAGHLPRLLEDNPHPSAASPFSAELQARFDQIQPLGEGGMGIVYKAYDRKLGRSVALKFLRREGAAHEATLLREAKALARVEHDHVCKIYELGVSENQSYLVMEFIEGQTLSEKADALTVEEKAAVIRDIALGVHEVHRLGLVHRDIKPANIMVMRLESGAWASHIMDFGLARDVGEIGQTQTGAIAGTPMFMAPEQARGEIRNLDRRTDVYALGATLYMLIGGKPLFEGRSMGEMLHNIIHQEPPALRRVNPGVPNDLDIIVMKCLEKEPARRYDSALALARDLTCFLEGDPISARRASMVYVGFKKARKHWVLVSLLSLLGISILIFSLTLLASERRGAAMARFSKEIGEELKSAELFLRNAHGLPLHDINREREMIRARLLKVEQGMRHIGEIGEGPGNYALGRGYLSLGELETAQMYLERAVSAGYNTPELHWSYGLLLGMRYSRGLEEANFVGSEPERKRKAEELERLYRDPARKHLEKARGGEVEEPAYLEGLLAFYDGHYDQAIERAKEAYKKAPWLYEAKKLEGDAYVQLAVPYRHDRDFDYEKLSQKLAPAEEAYEAALDIGRSDPDVYIAACGLYTTWYLGEKARGKHQSRVSELAEKRCAQAIQAHGDSVAAMTQTAFLKLMIVGDQVDYGVPLDKIQRSLSEVEAMARDALRRSSSDMLALYVLAQMDLAKLQPLASQLASLSRSDADEVISAYENLLRLYPRHAWGHNELGVVYLLLAQAALLRGGDVSALIREALEHFDAALEVDPHFAFPKTNKAAGLIVLAQVQLLHGKSPEPYIERCELFDESSGGPNVNVFEFRSLAYEHRAVFKSLSGFDPSAEYARSKEYALEGLKYNPEWHYIKYRLAAVITAQAEHQLRVGQDPWALLEEAQAVDQDAIHTCSFCGDSMVLGLRLRALKLQVQVDKGKAKPKDFDEHIQSCAEWSSNAHPVMQHPDALQACAEIHREHARFLLEKRKPADARNSIEQGMAFVSRALSRNPQSAMAWVVQGKLGLLKARAEPEGAARKALEEKAMQSFEKAFEINALLRRWYAPKPVSQTPSRAP